MQTTKRHHEISVIQRLIEEPHRFQFVQAVRILVRWLCMHGVTYDEAFKKVLRFQNSLLLNFPASEIETLHIDSASGNDSHALQLTLQQGESIQIRITPAFIGLLGANGVLPLHHSEYFAALQPRESDASARAFLDVFSNRMVATFYEAWGKYRVEHGLDTRGRDTLLPMLRALSGTTATPFERTEEAGSHGVTDDIAGYYAGLLRTRPISASTVSRVLTEYFGVAIELEEFIGCWDPIPKHKRSMLGTPNMRLGFGATLGVRQWRNDLRLRLRIGPLDEDQYARFMPDGQAARALEKMLAIFAVPCMQFEARLMLQRPYVKTMTLTTRDKGAVKRLGWNTYLTTVPGSVSRPETRYTLHVDK